jgi:hypothetical protein
MAEVEAESNNKEPARKIWKPRLDAHCFGFIFVFIGPRPRLDECDRLYRFIAFYDSTVVANGFDIYSFPGAAVVRLGKEIVNVGVTLEKCQMADNLKYDICQGKAMRLAHVHGDGAGQLLIGVPARGQMADESPSIARAAELSAPPVSSRSTLTTFQPPGMRPSWLLGSKLAASGSSPH